MLSCQKELFSLSNDETYLNGAYMSPQLKSVSAVGQENLIKKERPYIIRPEDFFTQREILKNVFAKFIKAENSSSIAIIPSVSYGIANAAKNSAINKGDEIILVDEQFPSNVYTWKELAKEKEAKLILVKAEASNENRAINWNNAILKAINKRTAVVAMAHIHWADGNLFDLKAIREKTLEVGAKLIIDGTQSVGALPFYINEISPDCLVCGGYKWLLGPYSLGLAYYNDSFNEGKPIEHNWINRFESENFRTLVDYQDQFKKGAERYSVGESSNFVLVPMLIKAIEQLQIWTPEKVQQYCHEISKDAIQQLRKLGCFIEDDAYRAKHLFGIYLPSNINLSELQQKLSAQKIHVSFRGNAIRVSPHVYNTKDDFDKFLSCF
jgi:selenocysteine lyase/cysteine desulfurase